MENAHCIYDIKYWNYVHLSSIRFLKSYHQFHLFKNVNAQLQLKNAGNFYRIWRTLRKIYLLIKTLRYLRLSCVLYECYCSTL